MDTGQGSTLTTCNARRWSPSSRCVPSRYVLLVRELGLQSDDLPFIMVPLRLDQVTE